MAELLCVGFILMILSIPLMFIYLRVIQKKSDTLADLDIQFLSRNAKPSTMADTIAREVSSVQYRSVSKIKITAANELGVVITQGNALYHWWEIRVDFTSEAPTQGHIYLQRAGVADSGVLRGYSVALKVRDAIVLALKKADPNVSIRGA